MHIYVESEKKVSAFCCCSLVLIKTNNFGISINKKRERKKKQLILRDRFEITTILNVRQSLIVNIYIYYFFIFNTNQN